MGEKRRSKKRPRLVGRAWDNSQSPLRSKRLAVKSQRNIALTPAKGRESTILKPLVFTGSLGKKGWWAWSGWGLTGIVKGERTGKLVLLSLRESLNVLEWSEGGR